MALIPRRILISRRSPSLKATPRRLEYFEDKSFDLIKGESKNELGKGSMKKRRRRTVKKRRTLKKRRTFGK